MLRCLAVAAAVWSGAVLPGWVWGCPLFWIIKCGPIFLRALVIASSKVVVGHYFLAKDKMQSSASIKLSTFKLLGWGLGVYFGRHYFSAAPDVTSLTVDNGAVNSIYVCI
ncbi:hypothetical protein AMECASPLE_015926 [Ameca splendens]|uniref:Uncharacterized protein n=1 Tax=Ameca splendens TaxID=208324 RepID=A0ABV0YP01_9TELE